MTAFAAPAIAILVFAIILIFTMVKSVPQGENWTVERFGRYTRTLDPGLRFLVPLVDRVGSQDQYDGDRPRHRGAGGHHQDNAMVVADAVAFYQVVDASKAAYEVRNLEQALKNISQTNIRAVLGSMDLDEALSNREAINLKLLGVIDHASSPWGVKVTRVEISDLAPPPDINEAMARQMKAERLKRAEILTAEGQKQSAILKAEGEREAQIREAEGRRQAAFLDAEARERSAEAEAKATTMVSEAIAKGDVQAINYFVAQKYTEALRDLAASPNAKTIMMPLEAASLIGSIAGIAEIARGARQGSGNDAPRRHLALVVGGARHPARGRRDGDRDDGADLVGAGGAAHGAPALARRPASAGRSRSPSSRRCRSSSPSPAGRWSAASACRATTRPRGSTGAPTSWWGARASW